MMDWLSQLMNTPFVQAVLQENIHLLLPEIILLLSISWGLVQASGASKQSQNDAWSTALWGTFIAIAVAKFQAFQLHINPQTMWLYDEAVNLPVFYNMLHIDLLFTIGRNLVLGGTFLVLLFGRPLIEKYSESSAEFPLLLMTASLGAALLCGVNDIIMLFVALETLGISSFILSGYFRDDVKSSEASLKFLLFGGASTAVILFGLSLVYGLAGGYTQFDLIAPNLANLSSTLQGFQPVVIIALVMVVAGMAFKLSAAPFHQWTPDVYEGAPLPVTAYLSVVSKIAAFVLLIRVGHSWLFNLSPDMAGAAQPILSVLIIVLSVLSMVIGNLAALRQENIKRMMAYSTIAHVGYVMLGFVVFKGAALASVLFYMLTYLYMNIGGFAVITLISQQTGRSDINAYAGLIRKKPFYTLAFSMFLLSLAGIPITAGFFAKFFLFQSVIQADSSTLWLIVLALLNSTISLYYYLNVIKVMVIDEPSDMVQALTRRVDAPDTVPIFATVLICLVMTLGLGFYAEPAMKMTNTALAQLGESDPYAGVIMISTAETITK